MKALLCHNFYRYAGGEDQVFRDESWLLETHGHEVIRWSRHNEGIHGIGKLQLARRTFWNGEVYRELRELIQQQAPDVIHFHNTFPLMSPAAYYAAKHEGVPVVHSLHNFRLICPGSTLLRDGKVCDQCVGRAVAWPSVVHACYQGNRLATAVTAGMNAWHRARGTWRHAVDRYIALTEQAKRTLVDGGLPAEKICVKPNFVQPDPHVGSGDGDYAIFVGRLSREKGIETLLDAWESSRRLLPLMLVGDGPLRDTVLTRLQGQDRIRWLGQRPFAEVLTLIGRSRMLIFPSIWYETFGRSVIEAFATGTPVIGSRMGAMQELIEDGRTGLLFRPGDADDLATKVEELSCQSAVRDTMSRAAREEYLRQYTAEKNYELLSDIYRSAGVRHLDDVRVVS